MQKLNQTQIIEKIENELSELTAVEIIINSENPTQCSVILNDKFFSCPYETTYNEKLIAGIKKAIMGKEILLIQFIDIELPRAWADAYTAGGIEPARHDRRVIFHPYNDMNEMFCIDQSLLWDITDEFKGTDHELTEEKCKWRYEIIKWYKNHLI